jgi:hypothetical protein
MARGVVCLIGTLLVAAVLFSPISCRQTRAEVIPLRELEAY